MSAKLEEFTALRQQMETLQHDVHQTLNNELGQVLGTTQTYWNQFTELQTREKAVLAQQEILKDRISSLRSEEERLRHASGDAAVQLEVYRKRYELLEQQRNTLIHEERELDELVEEREAAAKQEEEAIKKQGIRDESEVKIYERLLGLKVQSPKRGFLELLFQGCDPYNPDNVCSVTLDVSQDRISLTASNPDLSSYIAELEDLLNNGADLRRFVIESRRMLITRVESMRNFDSREHIPDISHNEGEKIDISDTSVS